MVVTVQERYIAIRRNIMIDVKTETFAFSLLNAIFLSEDESFRIPIFGKSFKYSRFYKY